MADEPKVNLGLEIAHVLFIDIVGYSRLLIDEQSEALSDLNYVVRHSETANKAEACEQLLRLPTGDGVALVFTGSAEAPVECALEISEALREKPNLQVRMGIHSGPVHQVGDVNDRANIAGAGINIAQRVMDCGDAGHILLSKRVADDLAQYRKWQPCLHDIGTHEVKHGLRLDLVSLYTDKAGNPALPQKLIPPDAKSVAAQAKGAVWIRPLSIAVGLLILASAFILVWRGNSSRDTDLKRTSSPAPIAIADKGIAVLPFDNLSRDEENAYLADGIQEEILTRLSKISDLKVISRTSASKFKTSPENPREIAAKLGVANLLEGSVQRSGDQLRVNVQLVNARSDAHLWADTFDRKLTDVFAIESEIAKAIADTLKAKLSGREQRAISTRPTENSEAHQLYLKGRYFWNKRTSDGLKAAIGYFSQAIEKDPGYAPPFAGLADAYALLPNYSQTTGKDAYPKAEAAALRALELDGESGEAHVSLANIRLWHKWGNAAEPEFKKGLEIDPNYSTGHQWYSIYLSVTGRLTEAIAEMEKAKELDPYSLIINTEAGCPYLYASQYDRAAECFKKAIEMDPDFPFAHFALAEAYDRLGRYKEALNEHRKAVEIAQRDRAIDLTGNDAPQAWYALTGPLENSYREVVGIGYWRDRLESVRKNYQEGTAPASEVAGIYAMLGDREQALSWLEKAYQDSDDFLVFLNIQPQFETLRSDKRFQVLAQKIFHPLPTQP